jgi:glycosyltransferase involved in cell wall biosynthesis
MVSPAGRKRFLLVAGYAESVVRFRGQLIRDLGDAGYEVHVAAPGVREGGSLAAEIAGIGAVPHSFSLARGGMSPLGDVRSFGELVALMRSIRPVAFLGYTIKPIVYGGLAARVCGVPHRFALVTGLGQAFDPDQPAWLRSLVGQLYRAALPGADVVFFQNPDDERVFRRMGIMASHARSLVVAGSGVDTEEYRQATIPPRPAFLLIARLIAAKGVREYVEAARRVRTSHPEVPFRLAGWIDAGNGSISEAELESWQEEGTIDFLGHLADVRQAIAEASVFVLPSYYGEGTPRVILEAMAMGRAIITTDSPGCRETVKDEVNGLLVPPRDVEALAAAMLRLVENAATVTFMGEQSRARAVGTYDVRRVNEAMLAAMSVTAT